jgi:hypothetical protein
MLVITKLAFIAVLGASATLAQPNQQSPVSQTKETTAEASVADKKICKKVPSTGTRLEKTACLTRKQWDELERESAY